MLRAAYQALAEIEQQPLDEQILDRIFSRFCIGK
jgi:tRNA U34 5-carboxymethylaminomethyl modifying GTPase MnmE/TrmE